MADSDPDPDSDSDPDLGDFVPGAESPPDGRDGAENAPDGRDGAENAPDGRDGAGNPPDDGDLGGAAGGDPGEAAGGAGETGGGSRLDEGLRSGPAGSGPAGDGEGRFERYGVEAAGEERGIGTVSVAQGLRVAERDDETTLRAYVTAGNRESVRIGSYLLVPYPDGETLFCRIVALEYDQEFRADDATEIHARRRMRDPGEFEERDYKFIAELDPVAVLFEEDGELKRRLTDRVPKPGAVLREATDAAQIKTGLNIPESGVFVGHLSVGGETVHTAASPPTVDYRLKDDYADADPLVFRHTLVAGGTGAGKTHAAKNVLRQYLDDDRRYPMEDGRTVAPAVVLFDPQDEYAQMHDDNPAVDASVARRLEREGIAHGGVEDTVALIPETPGSTYSGENHRAEQVTFTVPFSMVREYDMPWLVAGAGLNDNQYGALTTLLDRFFRTRGDDGTYQEFRSFLDDPGLREELDESGRVHEATFDAVNRRVRAIPGQVFDGDARPITGLDHTLVRPGGLSVVPTYHLSSTRAREMFVLAVATMLVDNKLSNDPRSERVKRTPVVLGMDEAHNFLADADNVQARRVVEKFTEAAKQGRKERLGLFLITQDPQDVADPVFKQVNTKLVLNLGDEDAIKSVNIPPSLEDKVPYMEQGQMVVYSPDNSEPVELTGLDHCVVRHGD